MTMTNIPVREEPTGLHRVEVIVDKYAQFLGAPLWKMRSGAGFLRPGGRVQFALRMLPSNAYYLFFVGLEDSEEELQAAVAAAYAHFRQMVPIQ